MKPVPVDLLTPHRLRRWVFPLGFGGLAVIGAVTALLPAHGAAFFTVARIVFVIAYLVLAGVGMSSTRRPAKVSARAGGLFEGGKLLVARESIRQVLSSRARGLTTIDVRGATPLALEVRSEADADALVAGLDPGRDTGTATYLATTTPTYMVVLAWMGLPALLSFPAQLLMMQGLGEPVLIAYAIVGVSFWLGASWWFMRRRRVTLSATHLTLPTLFGTVDEVVSLGAVTRVVQRDTFTLELEFTGRRSFKLKIYDPGLVADFLDRLGERSRVEVKILKS